MNPVLLLLACGPTGIDLGVSPDTAEPDDAEFIPGLDDTDTGEDDTDDEPDDPDLYEDGAVWVLTLDIEGDGWAELSRDGRDYVDATLGWDGREWPVAVHIKGSSSWQSIDQKPSLVVDVNRIDPELEFLGAKKFYLQNECYDPSQMSSTLSYAFYREWGYPASRTSFATLQVNGRDYGFYTVTEPHNDDFLQAWFADPNGNLYENAEAYCDVTDVSCMETEEVDEGNDDALRALGQAAGTSDADWRGEVEPLLNWERFISYLALEIAIVHWDSYSYDLSNYQLYHEPATDDWTLLTQSMDLDYGFRPWSYPNCGQYGMDIDLYTMGMLAEGCHADATCKAELAEALSHYADLLEEADGAARVRDLDARIGQFVKDDPRRYYDDRDYDNHVACLEEFFEERPGQIREWVAGQ